MDKQRLVELQTHKYEAAYRTNREHVAAAAAALGRGRETLLAAREAYRLALSRAARELGRNVGVSPEALFKDVRSGSTAIKDARRDVAAAEHMLTTARAGALSVKRKLDLLEQMRSALLKRAGARAEGRTHESVSESAVCARIRRGELPMPRGLRESSRDAGACRSETAVDGDTATGLAHRPRAERVEIVPQSELGKTTEVVPVVQVSAVDTAHSGLAFGMRLPGGETIRVVLSLSLNGLVRIEMAADGRRSMSDRGRYRAIVERMRKAGLPVGEIAFGEEASHV